MHAPFEPKEIDHDPEKKGPIALCCWPNHSVPICIRKRRPTYVHIVNGVMMVESNKRPQLFRIWFHHRLCIFQPIHIIVVIVDAVDSGGDWIVPQMLRGGGGGRNVWTAEDRWIRVLCCGSKQGQHPGRLPQSHKLIPRSPSLLASGLFHLRKSSSSSIRLAECKTCAEIASAGLLTQYFERSWQNVYTQNDLQRKLVFLS
jgi:hypothetical protein